MLILLRDVFGTVDKTLRTSGEKPVAALASNNPALFAAAAATAAALTAAMSAAAASVVGAAAVAASVSAAVTEPIAS